MPKPNHKGGYRDFGQGVYEYEGENGPFNQSDQTVAIPRIAYDTKDKTSTTVKVPGS
jgi:hypothetical protein